jgi:hypothetical protein
MYPLVEEMDGRRVNVGQGSSVTGKLKKLTNL